MTRALEAAGVRERMKGRGVEPMPMTPAEFDTYVRQENAANAAVVKVAGINAR